MKSEYISLCLLTYQLLRASGRIFLEADILQSPIGFRK